MALLSKDGAEFLLRWLHFLSGITWIGLLYYFNFVQGPFFAEADAATKSVATQKLVPRALWWFRWSATVTFLSGALIIAKRAAAATHWPPTRITHSTEYWVALLVVVAMVELNALKATTGITTKPIEKIPGVITTGFVVWAVVFVLVKFVLSA